MLEIVLPLSLSLSLSLSKVSSSEFPQFCGTTYLEKPLILSPLSVDSSASSPQTKPILGFMAVMLLLLLLSILSRGSDAAWCVCRPDAPPAAQQRALDYACGSTADCNPILPSGPCYQPNTVLAHCSYAVNSYYQRQSQAALACDFAGAAVITYTDPSANGCSYPANASAAGAGTTTAPPPPGTTTSAPPPPGTTTLSPPTSIFGLGPTATTGIPTDGSGAGLLSPPAVSLFSVVAAIFSGLVLLAGRR